MESDTASETRPLISLTSVSQSPTNGRSSCRHCLLPGCGWLLTKPVLSIMFIHAVMSAAYATVMMAALESRYPSQSVFTVMICVYIFTAAVTLFSPLSGFLADVHCGRYRVYVTCICLMFSAYVMTLLLGIIALVRVWSVDVFVHSVQPVVITLAVLSLLLFMPGLAGYQANFIQFGLDQLLEAPSSSLALFIHWIMWAETVGTLVVQIVDALYVCEHLSNTILILPSVLVLTLTILLLVIVICLKKCKFNAEPHHHNPYRTIYKVLNFARKHKYPLRRSAFTYCDDEELNRIDFAKERYGGPFTTEQVEDVKTFFKILLVLLALCPIFVLEIPMSVFVTVIFGMHTANRSVSRSPECTSLFILLQKGSIRCLTALILLPLFIWVVFAVFQRRTLKIFSRLLIAVLFYLGGVVSMLGIDITGHMMAERSGTVNHTSCMFVVDSTYEPALQMHWSVLLIPGLLLGIGQPLVMATSFEFISAQSPSSMKGLLVGVFFTTRAVFQLISGVALIPFSYRSLWESESMREHPPVTNCGFGYLSFTCVVAVIGLVLLLLAVKKYKYRERDDRPFDQRFAVDVYSRYIDQALETNQD